MKKVVEISVCWECPNIIYKTKWVFFMKTQCAKANMRDCGKRKPIPEWCPLPNAEGVK